MPLRASDGGKERELEQRQRYAEKKLQELRKSALRVAHKICGNPAAAEDVVQEASANAYFHIESLQVLERFDSWYFKIVRNEAHQQIRKTATRTRCHKEAHLLNSLHTARFHCVQNRQSLTRQEARLLVKEIAARIPKDLRKVFLLRYRDQLLHKEISYELGISIAAVKRRLKKAHLLIGQILLTQ